MRNRIGYVDSLKGITMLLVIIGHFIQYVLCPDTFRDNIAFGFIYSFHMGLFMALSGYTVRTNYASICSVLQQIDKRAVNLMLPFVSWAVIGNLLFGGPSLSVVLNDTDSGLWFLHALFFIYAIFILSHYLLDSKKRIVRYSCIIIVFLILRKLAESNLLPIETAWISLHYLNFAMGYVIRDNERWLLRKTFAPYAVLILFYIAMFCISHQTINSVTINHIFSNVFYRTLMISIITIALFGLAFRFEDVLKRFGLEYIGRVTLGLYAVHQPLLQQMRISFPSYYQWATTGLGGAVFLFSVIILSITIVELLKQSSFTSIVFLGRNISRVHASA